MQREKSLCNREATSDNIKMSVVFQMHHVGTRRRSLNTCQIKASGAAVKRAEMSAVEGKPLLSAETKKKLHNSGFILKGSNPFQI